jgi:very-short-patch-repair endonuclease
VRGPNIKRKNVSLARNLRSNSTDVERLLWNRLRARSINGLKFRRQYPVGDYIVDFVCLEKRVVVELDGGQHNESQQDTVRDVWLTRNGYKVVRIWNNDVLGNIEGTVDSILDICD